MINTIYNLILGSVFIYLMKKHLSLRFLDNKINIGIILVTICTIGLVSFNNELGRYDYLLIITFFVNSLIMFRGRMIEKILIVIPFWIIEIATSTVVALLKSYFSKNIYLDVLMMFFAVIVISILFAGYFDVIKKINYHSFTNIACGYICLVLFLILVLVSGLKYDIVYNENSSTIVYIFLVIILILFFLLTYYDTFYKLGLKSKLDLSKENEKVVTEKYKLLNKQYETSFYFLHDLLKTCQRLNLLLDKDDYQGLKDEINTLTTTTFREFNSIYSDSMLLNTLINNRLETLRQYDITVLPTIEYNNFSFLTVADQFILFDCLLDLAIDEVKTVTNRRYIFIKSIKKAKQIIIQFKFNCSNCDLQEKVAASLNELLNRYHGISSVSSLQDGFVSVMIMFVKVNNI